MFLYRFFRILNIFFNFMSFLFLTIGELFFSGLLYISLILYIMSLNFVILLTVS